MNATDKVDPHVPAQGGSAELAVADAITGGLPPQTSWLPGLRPLHWRDPVQWLKAGWRDFIAQPGIGLFYGACFVLMGWALAALVMYRPVYVLALTGGFMLLSPFLCLGLYEASRCREQSRPTTLLKSLMTWRRNLSALAIFCGVLLVLEMLWSRFALVIVAVSFNTMPDGTDWGPCCWLPGTWPSSALTSALALCSPALFLPRVWSPCLC